MTTAPPRKLYKYHAFTALTLTRLKARSVWFGKPSGFNDPFDCAVPLKFRPFTVQDAARVLEDKTAAGWSTLKSNPGNVDANGRPTEHFRADLEQRARDQVEQIRKENYDELGVTCFSETYDNSLLWSHYGQGHRGLCLEFDTAASLFGKIQKVEYVDKVPEIDLADMLLGDSSQVLSGLLTKASCWAYEREWRTIYASAETLYHYGVDALTCVYLGAALTDTERDVIRQLLQGTPTKLYQMRRSTTTFAVEADSVEYQPYQRPTPS